MAPDVARIVAIILLATAPALAADWGGTVSKWHGHDKHDFQVDGRNCFVVVPNHPAPGNPWIWRASFPGFHDEADILLVDRGFHLAYIDANNMYGSPRAMGHWDKFYQHVVGKGLSERVALEGVSRGGLYVFAFAARWPERVACIYNDTPVCDIRSWPGGKGTGKGGAGEWRGALAELGLTDESSVDYKGDPIDPEVLEPIAKADIPILHIVALNDVIVPPAENTLILAERYRKMGGSMQIIEVKEGTPQSGGHHFTHPDPLRVADFVERWSGPLKRAAPKTPGDHFVIRGSLDNARIRFERDKVGRVVFMGGSITQGGGWREAVMQYLRERFPQTKFDFVNAGISSTGTTPGAFRFERDALAGGPIDLLFEEAAVNDSTNGFTGAAATRGMEGIIRRARTANAKTDIVVMHFAAPWLSDDYRAGRVPEVIDRHEKVAERYGVSTIQLAKEVTDRIDAGQFTWEGDFKDLHPSPYGHRLYAASIRRLFAAAWGEPLAADAQQVDHPIPEALDKFSYDRARLAPPSDATQLKGFAVVERCNPTANGVGGGTRPGFTDVPMLVGTTPGSAFSLKFKGRGVGLFVAAGPDAGVIEHRIDEGEWKRQDLFTKWSGGLHLPWTYVLAAELDGGDHTLHVRIAADKNAASKGHACRVVHLLVNE